MRLLAVPIVVSFSQESFDLNGPGNTTPMSLMASHAPLHSPLPSGSFPVPPNPRKVGGSRSGRWGRYKTTVPSPFPLRPTPALRNERPLV